MRILITILFCLMHSIVLADETVVSELSQNQISITTDFSGSEIFVFGAVKRDQPLPEDSNLDVIVEISGPPEEILVRRKARKLGIWINTDSAIINRAPSFYSIASTAPIHEILSDNVRQKLKLGLDYAVSARFVEASDYKEAVIRIRQNAGVYTAVENPVKLTQDTLFTSRIALPANIVEGDYTAIIYLVRDQKVISANQSIITVRKTGLERWIYNLAHEQPLVYGLLSLFVALLAGWTASEIFRLLRR